MTRKPLSATLTAVIGASLFSSLALAAEPGPVNPANYTAPVRVACVGDSITYGTGAGRGMSYPSQLQTLLGDKWTVQNFGVGGRTLLKKGDHPYWSEKAYTNALDFKPDVVVIMLGTNDTKPQNWSHHEEFYSNYKELVKSFEALPSKPHIYICRPCPVPAPGNYGINETNVELEIPLIDKLAHEENLGLIDMHAALASKPELEPDRVHPNTAGAGVMAGVVYHALTGKPAPITPATEPLAQALDKNVNTAIVPVPKLEIDSYLWYQRHAQVLELQRRMKPDVVLVGDSITNFWGGEPHAKIQNGPKTWQQTFGSHSVLNMGFGWDRTENVLWRLDHGEMDGLTPKLIVLNIGTNNFTGTAHARANTPEEICAGVLAVWEKLHAKSPSSKLLVMGVFPRGASATDPHRAPIKELNQLLSKALAGKPDTTFLDIGDKFLESDGSISKEMMRDGTHPSEKGYAIWGAALASYLP